MHLPGRLSSSTLGDLLGSLHRAKVTGTVELAEIATFGGVTGRTHRLHLRAGLVVGVDTPLAGDLHDGGRPPKPPAAGAGSGCAANLHDRRAPDGFAALRELDADGDGRITPADPGFSRLLVWSDRDGDRRSSADELAPASAASACELLSIDLDYTSDPRCDARGNCEVERASFRYRDAAGVVRTGAVVDVHLRVQR
jgi:hypothetical protein